MVLITAPADGTAAKIARDLVERRLAACVNVIHGVNSVYRWEGKVEDGKEDLLVVKTTNDALEDLKARIVETHPYSVPEFVALPVISGSRDYLDWLIGETRGT